MRLRQALNIQRGDLVSFVGAGGKSSALFRLGNELAAEGWRVVGTTTTYVNADGLLRAPGVLDVSVGLRPAAISRMLTQHGFIYLYSKVVGEQALGIAPEQAATLADLVDSDVTLVEADTADGLPFKAPYPSQPVIPEGTSLVVPMASMDVIGKPLEERYVYNLQAIIDQFGYPYAEKIKPPWIASVVRDEVLGLKDIPDSARIVPILTKVQRGGYSRLRARLTARLTLINSRIHGVAMGDLGAADPIYEVRRRVGAVILAGGLSSRMGESKVLMKWDDRPIINTIIDKLRRARVEQIVVVTGHWAAEVRSVVAKEGVTVTHNAGYMRGDMLSSLQAGIRALTPEMSGMLVYLGDQPHLDIRVINDVLNAYAEGKGTIIAPSYQMKRGHPILIDRAYWSELLELPIDGSPREVINRHAGSIGYVVTKDDSILRDIDTPEDYARERRLAGLK